MRRLLVTGASGFLGWNITRFAEAGWEVFGVTHSHSIEIPGVRLRKVDLTRFDDVKRLFGEVKPQAVIHTAAASDANFCQKYPDQSRKINVDAALHIAALSGDLSIPCVFTSSDLVFNGLNAPYREEDPVSPVSVYGEQKALAEGGMFRCYPRVLVCRMPLMFGDPGPTARTFIQPMIEALREGRDLKLFTDEFRTPVSGGAAVRGILMALGAVDGILHLGGTERISRYDFGELLARVLGIEKANIIACSRGDVLMPAPRPPDVSLDSTKAFGMGFDPGTLRGELAKLSCLWGHGNDQ